MTSGDRLDLSSDPNDGRENPPPAQPGEKARRPFIGVHFACCGAYGRAYLTADESAFVGRCPRCVRSIRFPISPDGSSDRFVSVS